MRTAEAGTQPATSGHGRSLLSRPLQALVALTFAGGLIVRLAGVADSPITFHPTRQYLGLRVARAMFLEDRPGVPADVQRVVRANASSAPVLEPRFLETAVAAGYRLFGGERLWLGGAVSSVLWALGGACLFLIARRLASDLAAGVAVGFYLFLPYGIVASRAFQPDPAMVAFMLAALLAMVRYHDEQTTARLATAGLLSALAILVKPTVVFVTVGALLALAISRRGLRRGVLSPPTLSLLALSLLPAAAFYLHGIVTGAATASNAKMSFIPGLFRQAAYWKGWLHMVNATVGTVFLLAAVGAVVLARRREAKFLVAGLFAGYVVYGLVFNYHIHTHDYYQLQLIPIVALGLGAAGDAAVSWIRHVDLPGPVKMAPVPAVAGLAVAVLIAGRDFIRPQPSPSLAELTAQSEQVGDLVSHSTRTVMLSPFYGWPLGYHGNIAGTSWPRVAAGDFRLMRLLGQQIPSTEDRLQLLIRSGSRWFIITEMSELERQPDLKPVLERHGRLAGQGKGFLVYDLRSAP